MLARGSVVQTGAVAQLNEKHPGYLPCCPSPDYQHFIFSIFFKKNQKSLENLEHRGSVHMGTVGIAVIPIPTPSSRDG